MKSNGKTKDAIIEALETTRAWRESLNLDFPTRNKAASIELRRLADSLRKVQAEDATLSEIARMWDAFATTRYKGEADFFKQIGFGGTYRDGADLLRAFLAHCRELADNRDGRAQLRRGRL